MIIGVEDDLSEAVTRCIFRNYAPSNPVTSVLKKRGKTWLRSRIQSLSEVAHVLRVFLLVDLDDDNCPPDLIADWLGPHSPQYLDIRVAVREVEAWLLADRQRLADFLSVSVARIPRDPETVNDPKECLLRLALRAPRRLRNDLVFGENGNVRQGPGYNQLLSSFVAKEWSPQNAALHPRSLDRAIQSVTMLPGQP